MSCSIKTLKVFTLIWDLVFTLFGLNLIGIGIYTYIKFEQFRTAAFVVFGLGLLVLLIALFGGVSALRESNRLLKVFTAILVILILLQILFVVFLGIFQNSFLINVDKTFDQIWHDQHVPITPGNASRIASFERWLECCGNKGPSDYILAPYSCYVQNDRLSQDGCRQKLIDYMHDRWTAFHILAISLVIVEIILGVFAYVLGNSILNRWRRANYYPK